MKLKFGIMLWQNLIRNPHVRKPCPEKQGSILASNRAFQIPVTFHLMKNPSSVPQCAAPGTPSYHLLSPPAVLDLLQWQETTFFLFPQNHWELKAAWNEMRCIHEIYPTSEQQATTSAAKYSHILAQFPTKLKSSLISGLSHPHSSSHCQTYPPGTSASTVRGCLLRMCYTWSSHGTCCSLLSGWFRDIGRHWWVLGRKKWGGWRSLRDWRSLRKEKR